MDPSDAELISRSLSEPEAFTEIFDRHYVAISAYLRRRLEEARADDLASEVFLIAFRRRGDFELERSSARPWLFGIAANLSRSARREERRRLRAYARTGHEVEHDHADDAIERADAAQAAGAMADALLALDRDQREVILLHSWTDLSYSEIAEALAMPIGTVRSRIARGRRRLQRLVGSQHRDTDELEEVDPHG